MQGKKKLFLRDAEVACSNHVAPIRNPTFRDGCRVSCFFFVFKRLQHFHNETVSFLSIFTNRFFSKILLKNAFFLPIFYQKFNSLFFTSFCTAYFYIICIREFILFATSFFDSSVFTFEYIFNVVSTSECPTHF